MVDEKATTPSFKVLGVTRLRINPGSTMLSGGLGKSRRNPNIYKWGKPTKDRVSPTACDSLQLIPLSSLFWCCGPYWGSLQQRVKSSHRERPREHHYVCRQNEQKLYGTHACTRILTAMFQRNEWKIHALFTLPSATKANGNFKYIHTTIFGSIFHKWLIGKYLWRYFDS